MRLSGDFQLRRAFVTSCNCNWSSELSKKFGFSSRGLDITRQWERVGGVCLNQP